MEKIKRYFEYWSMDGVILSHAIAIFVSIIIFAGVAQSIEMHIPITGWLWQHTLLVIIITTITLHAVIIGVVQSKFTLTKPSGYSFANIVIKDDGNIVELTKPALWGKGKIVKINWADGYKYNRENRFNREKSITLSYILIYRTGNITVSIPLCINMELIKCINPIELFKILLNNQPNAITAGKNLSVDKYFNSVLENIADANYELTARLCKGYLDGKISESVLMNEMTKELILGDIDFPGKEITGYSIGQPAVTACPKS